MSAPARSVERIAELHVARLLPSGERVGRALWVHGAGEHGARHARAAERLARRGFEVLLPDLPGHGATGGPSATPQALRASLARLICSEGEGPPFDLVGHSMGGLLVIGLARELRSPLRRCVLSAPFFGPARALPSWKLRAGRLAARLWPTLRFSLGLDAEDLLRDPREQELWRRDPLRREGIGARAGAALLDEAALRAAESTPLGLPCLVLVASDDRVAAPSLARAWAARCGAACVELAGLRHEIWREPESALAQMALERFLLEDDRPDACGL